MPYVIVNCAMTADGKIAGKSRRQVRISSAEDLQRVKRLRSESDAILVGVGTVLADDPHLIIKGHPREENPLRVVLDSRGRTPSDAKVLDGKADTLIATSEAVDRTWKNAETVRLGKKRVDLQALMKELDSRGISKLLVEGGGETIWSFFEAKLVDEYKVFVGGMILGGKGAPTPCDGLGFEDESAVRLRLKDVQRLDEGVLLSYEVLEHGH